MTWLQININKFVACFFCFSLFSLFFLGLRVQDPCVLLGANIVTSIISQSCNDDSDAYDDDRYEDDDDDDDDNDDDDDSFESCASAYAITTLVFCCEPM